MQLQHCFFSGTPSPDCWSQAIVQHHGERVALLVVTATGESALEHGKEVVSDLVRASDEGMDRDQFLTLFRTYQDPAYRICAAFVDGEAITLFAQGDVQVWLSRGGERGIVLKGEEVGQYLSGQVKPQDFYVFATTPFITAVPFPDPKAELDVSGDQAIAKLHTQPDSSGMAAVFLQARPPQSVVAPVVAPKPKRELPKLPTIKLASHKKLLVWLGGAVAVSLLILIGSLVLKAQRQKQIASFMTPYQQQYATLQASSGDRLTTVRGLRDLRDTLQSQEQTIKDRVLKTAIDTLLTQVSASYDTLSGEKHIEKLEVFYDFRLVSPDFVASSGSLDTAGKLGVYLDSTHQRLLSLSLEKKEAIPLTVDKTLTNTHMVTVDSQKAYVLADNGVMQIPLPLDKLGAVVVSRDSAWVTPAQVAVFGTNLYVLDKGARDILKYDLENPTASASGWFHDKGGIDFAGVNSLQIDGSVWLGTNTGSVLHYAQGSKLAFSYQGVLDVPSGAVSLYTNKDTDALYVLDPHGKRLLVLSKDGTYRSAISSPDFATATSLFVDESTKKAYVLAGSLVYVVPL